MTKLTDGDTITTMAREEYIQVRVTSDMKQRIQKAADMRGMTVSSLILLALTNAYPDTLAQSPFEQLTQPQKSDYSGGKDDK